jgi:hypothetical protein
MPLEGTGTERTGPFSDTTCLTRPSSANTNLILNQNAEFGTI